MATAVGAPREPPRSPGRRRGLRFHAAVALLIAAFMVIGFGYEVDRYVLHPTVHRPALLIAHSAAFIGWMLLYVAQTLLIQFRRVRFHRLLGWLGLALALAMPPLGIATALVMRRFDLTVFPSTNMAHDLAFLAAPLADIIAFTPCALLAIAWRRRPDYHRRLMFLATAAIAEAGFGRLPIPGLTTWFYLTNLPLYAAGIVHDRLTIGRVHPVYRWGVPLIVLDEAAAMYLWLAHPAWWLAVCRSLTGLG